MLFERVRAGAGNEIPRRTRAPEHTLQSGIAPAPACSDPSVFPSHSNNCRSLEHWKATAWPQPWLWLLIVCNQVATAPLRGTEPRIQLVWSISGPFTQLSVRTWEAISLRLWRSDAAEPLKVLLQLQVWLCVTYTHTDTHTRRTDWPRLWKSLH